MLLKPIRSDIIENIDFICRLSFDTFNIPVYFLDDNENILFSYSLLSTSNPLYPDNNTFIKQIFRSLNSANLPVITTTKYLENFISISIKLEEKIIGTIIAGPTIQSEISGQLVDSIISENNLPLSCKRELIDYYSHCYKKEYTTLLNIVIFLYYAIFQEKLDFNTLMSKNSSFIDLEQIIERDVGAVLSKNRQNDYIHHSALYEKRLLQCIKEGNLEQLMGLRYPLDGKPGILSKGNPLRSQKNNTICLTTLVTRAGIDAGLNSDLAYTLSDQYILQVEELNDVNDIEQLINRMLVDFTTRVKNAKKSSLSKVISECHAYIFRHVYDNITLTELSKLVNMNANYLSELFRIQTGITIRDYIQEQKIEEAKKLMDFSKLSLLEISTNLNFCNQSHFSRIFKKVTGLSPRQFRERKTL